MTFTDAAREVLRLEGRPLHYKEITELAIEKNLLSHVGKSPEVTMGARLAATLKKGGDENPVIRVKPGVFALRDWDEETIKLGLQIKRAPAKKKAAAKSPSNGASEAAKAKAAQPAEEPAAAAPEAADEDAPAAAKPDIERTPQSPDEALRAEIAASATEVFSQEDDDDQPILRPAEEEQPEGGRRRRRRRRRRGSRSSGGGDQDSSALPSYTATPVDGDAGGMPRGPQVIELSGGEIPSLNGLAGRELADAVAMILATFDRTVGAVSLRQITDTAQRRGKLSGEIQLAQSQIAAVVRADNSRRTTVGLRPRFRMAGGRVGLTDWLLDNDLARYERDVLQAVGRYREVARKAFARKCAELPGHAFIELCVMLIERLGVSKLRQVKFPGASGAEAHFAGVMYQPAGVVPGLVGAGEGTRLAIVIRKDGRDLGRERVTELRGGAHHYDAATVGWMFTAGQLLSGAREDAAVAGAMPVALLDGPAIASLCADHDIAVVRSSHPIAIPDVDLFEALRSS